tara:strand:- start:1055 stop:1942 length:888 start_codon:yes stop_codon:yes gene_type:complete
MNKYILVPKKNYLEAFSQKGAYVEIDILNKYINNKSDKYYVHKKTGLLINKRKKSSKYTADQYSNSVFKKKFTNSTYSAKIPAVQARLTYVSVMLNKNFELHQKKILDAGAGTGEFLELMKTYKCNVFGVEPKKENCEEMRKKNISCEVGTIENFYVKNKFDIVSVLWTFCNMYNPLKALLHIKKLLKKNGILVAADSSRIHVHPRKSLDAWVGKNFPRHLNPFHFSNNTLKGLLMYCGFKILEENRYHDTDYLVIIAKNVNRNYKKLPADNFRNVIGFFKLWDELDQKIRKYNK